MSDFYKLSQKEVFAELNTNSKGLDKGEVKKRLDKYWLNEIKEKKVINPISDIVDSYFIAKCGAEGML